MCYLVLSDEQRRAVYDLYGAEGVTQGHEVCDPIFMRVLMTVSLRLTTTLLRKYVRNKLIILLIALAKSRLRNAATATGT